MLAGDDPAARSSSIAHQSEQALIHCGIPILNPAHHPGLPGPRTLRLGALALLRLLGGLQVHSPTPSTALAPSRSVRSVCRSCFPKTTSDSEAGLGIGWGNLPLAAEQRLFEQRLQAAQAFVRANGLDRIALDSPRRRLGIVTTGKAYLDVRQALEELGIDASLAAELGLSLYKVAMPWPLRARRRETLCGGAGGDSGRRGEAATDRGAARLPALQPPGCGHVCSASAMRTAPRSCPIGR